MTSISSLRQIVTDMHSFAPQGLRKAARAELAEMISEPSRFSIATLNRMRFAQPGYHGYSKSERSFGAISKLIKSNSKNSISDYLSKIYDTEQNVLIKKIIKNLGIEFKNETNDKIHPDVIFSILQGLTASKKAGLKLPKNVILEEIEDCRGYFRRFKPKNIYVDPSGMGICSTTIHETVHKNDRAVRIVRCIPVIGTIERIGGKLTTSLNKKIIKQEIRKYAATNREEFLACTAEKLIAEQKIWSDLDPKIKKLYDMFLGPKLKID